MAEHVELANLWRPRLRDPSDDFVCIERVWVVEHPAIPGCISQLATRNKALQNIEDAIAQCLEARMEQGLPLTVETKQIKVAAE